MDWRGAGSGAELAYPGRTAGVNDRESLLSAPTLSQMWCL